MKYSNIIMTILFFVGIFTNTYALTTKDHKGIYYDQFHTTDNVVIHKADGLKLNYSASLINPGDYYELSFDVVNDSGVDMYIYDYHFGKTDNYIQYNLTYQNGDVIHKGDIIKNGERKKLKYSVSYMSLVPDDLYSFDSSFDLHFEQVL